MFGISSICLRIVQYLLMEQHLHNYFPTFGKQDIHVSFNASLAVKNASALFLCMPMVIGE